jgi:hypothetical protein
VKFWEAVALALVLGAGIVSWVYVQDTANAKSNLRNSLRSVQDAFTVSDTKNAIRLEAAVTRASMGRDLPVGTLDNYAYAWNSPEVRDAWLKRTENEVRNLANILFVIRGAEERHKLNEHTTNLAEQVAELRSELGRIVEALGGEAGAEGALSFTGSDASRHLHSWFGPSCRSQDHGVEKREKLLLIGHEHHPYDASIHQDRLTSDPIQLQTKGQLR